MNAIAAQITTDGMSGANGTGPISTVWPNWLIAASALDEISTPLSFNSESWYEIPFCAWTKNEETWRQKNIIHVQKRVKTAFP